MRTRSPRLALIPAACALFLAPAVPALAATPPPAVVTPSAAQPALPSPTAPYSGQTVPGITGAAAQENDPPVSASQRLAQINAVEQGTAESGAAAAPPGPAGLAAPGIAPWKGQFHGLWGTDPQKTTYGAEATQSLNPRLTAPKTGAVFIYAPTLDPSSIDTIEMTTIYDGGGNYVGAWDWGAAKPGFAKVAIINSNFLARYATAVSGRYFYSVRDVQTKASTNTWTAYLYNYKNRAWDTFYTSSDKAKLSGNAGGWDQDEVWTDYDSSTAEAYYCTATYGDLFESTGLKYRLTAGGAWRAATPSDSTSTPAYPDGSDLGCGAVGFALPTENSTLAMTNATHGAAEITGSGSGRCIDTSGAKFTNGTNEQLWTCHNGAGQTWAYNGDGELTVDGGRYCLDATGNGTANGTKLELWRCRNTANQEWTFSVHNTLVGIGSGKCVNAAGAGTANGTQLQLWQCDAASSQRWSWS
jgi:hypothetical protein